MSDKISGGHALIDHLAAGLGILRRYCPDSVQITEAGGWITVWDWYEADIVVPGDDANILKSLGWVHDEQMKSWNHKLSD